MSCRRRLIGCAVVSASTPQFLAYRAVLSAVLVHLRVAEVDLGLSGISLCLFELRLPGIPIGGRGLKRGTFETKRSCSRGTRMTEFDLTGHTANSFDRGVGAREDGCVVRIIGQWSHGDR
jgi:hypothetical protein